MIGRVYAESGSHGTGKTTAIFEVARNLKLAHPDKTIAVLSEFASLSPLPINKKATRESQMWLFTTQISKELEMLSRFDLVVSDRCAVDPIAYTKYWGWDRLAESMISMARYHLPVYRSINFRFISLNNFWHADGLRETEDKRFRLDIEKIMLDIYYELGIEFKAPGCK